jgi:hypothetical protein
MRKTLVLLLGVCLLTLFVGSVSARDIDGNGYQQKLADDFDDRDAAAAALQTYAAVDTFCMVWWDFEVMDWQGWQQIDVTAQIDTFSHIDDFAGLAGGFHGQLVPIKDAQSLWCGARYDASDFYLCGWVLAPGYGSNWNQIVTTDAFTATGGIVDWSYYIAYDSELNWDFTYAEYDAGTLGWIELARYHGTGVELAEHTIYLSTAATKLRFHFVSDSNTDDQDGQNNTDGGFIVDSITVSDVGGVVDYEDFESYPVGAGGEYLVSLGCFWEPTIEDAFGIYSGLSASLQDKDPCGENFGTQVTFFHGSIYPSSDYPGLWDTPFCEGGGGLDLPCQDEMILSPVIDMTKYSTNRDNVQDADIPPADLARLGGARMDVTTYYDLPSENLVYFTWQVRSIDETGCPQAWRDRRTVYYGGGRTYNPRGFGISDLVGDDPIQVNVGVKDMCYQWYSGPGDCAHHTPAPWMDNIRVYRYKTYGPSWQMQSWDWFQDMFPGDGEMEGYVRADICNDIWPEEANTTYEMGDSCVISCTAILAGGLDTTATGEDKVYFHCNVEYIGDPSNPKPDIVGSVLEDDYGFWDHTDGNGWDIFLMEKSRAGENHAIQPDKYMIDLNDTLFTRGYEIQYYFSAWDFNGEMSTYPRTAMDADGNRGEFTTLPLLINYPDPAVLFVDDFDWRGVTWVGDEQTYFESAVAAILPEGEPMPERYDKGACSSNQSCGIGAFVTADVDTDILCVAYEKIVHASGNLNSYTIEAGNANESGHFNKQDDAGVLVNWLDNSDHKVGLLILGDQVAYDLYTGAAEPSALELLSSRCGATIVDREYYQKTGGEAGGVISPKITGVSGTNWDGLEYYIDGGCPGINKFAVLEKTGVGEYALQYPDYNSTAYYAGIYTDETNLLEHPRRTLIAAHSMYAIQNYSDGPLARIEFLKDCWEFFENGVNSNYTDTEVPKVYSLAQNFPNPFNPSTRIQFSLPVKGHVSLRIYNVAGQLVKTLQDGVMDAGSHELTWDGSNNLGANVASGVYFYKINAGDNYENMKKMVLLR